MPRAKYTKRRKRKTTIKKSTTSCKSKQKVELNVSGTKNINDEWTTESDTSPFKGFLYSPSWNEEDTVPLKDLIDTSQNEETQDEFDKLLDSPLKSHFPNKTMRTYTNKKKIKPEPKLLEFEDCKNRDDIIHWLNDNRNVFDKLTQTQREYGIESDEEIPLTFDMPSVSQINKENVNKLQNKTVRKRHRSPYKLRARSLNIHITKNGAKGRNKRHSLAGDTPSMENYHIEEVVTDDEVPVPAAEAKLLVNLMEDECLSALEKEILQKHKKEESNQSMSGWERIKDINKTINGVKKQPKQLNITLQSSQNKKGENSESNKIYDLNELENFFIDKMEKLMKGQENVCSPNASQSETCTQSLLKAGNDFLEVVKKIPNIKSILNSSDLRSMISEIKMVLNIDQKVTCEAAAQTASPKTCSRKVQTILKTKSIGIQTETKDKCGNCANNNNVINKVQQSHKIVQTEVDKISIEIQTELLNNHKILFTRNQLPTSGSITPSDIFPFSQIDKFVSEDKPQKTQPSSSLNHTFDEIQFDTETILQKEIKPEKVEAETVEDKLTTNEDVPNCVEPMIVCSKIQLSKGVKRVLPTSPVDDSQVYRKKRPCNKFIKEDLTIDFESCAVTEEQKIRNDNLVNLISDESDDNYDEYFNNILKKHDKDLIKKESERESPSKIDKTQRDIEELEEKIRNAVKPSHRANIISEPQLSTDSDVIFIEAERNLSRIEKDLTYFQAHSPVGEGETTPKQIRKKLFQSQENKKFSESLWDDQTVVKTEESVADVTITRENVDVIMDELNRESDGENDKEVQKILSQRTPKITILQNVVVKRADSVRVKDEDDEDGDDFILSGVDFVEMTPQKKRCSSFSQQRSESFVDILLPPPLEFQDVEMTSVEKENSKSNETKADSPRKSTLPRCPLAVVNKVTSTPITQKEHSERIAISPISIENNRIPGPIETAHKSKFSPLTIVKTSSQSQKNTRQTGTPKQKSILNYVRPSQESQETQSTPTMSKNKPCISCSRIGRDQVMAISTMANRKLVTYSSSFSRKVTHMILSVNNQNRIEDHTIKSVSAIAAGIWVLNFKWVQECLAKNTIVPEEPYEVLDVSGIPGPKKSRLTRSSNPLLKGYKIYVSPPFLTTALQDVENIIKMLGGEVAPSPEHLLDKDNYICLIITEGKATQDCDWEKFETWLEVLGVVTVDFEWLSRSVGQYQLQSLIPFTLCADDTIETLGYPPELTSNVPVSFMQSTSST